MSCGNTTSEGLSKYQSLNFLHGDHETSYDFFGKPIPSTFDAYSSSSSIINPAMKIPVNDAPVKRGKTVCTPSYQASAILPHSRCSTTQDIIAKPLVPTMIGGGQTLRSVVTEIPELYQSVFKNFPYFNVVQTKVMDDVFHSGKSLVVCAPTGSGKTVIFELAIIRLLMSSGHDDNFKIIYMAPIKALCSERYEDWKEKFMPFGITCFELTGDTDIENYSQLQMVNLIFTTPEKWDSTTRRWKDNRFLVQLVKLFLIDEIHIVNDKNRGATIEAVISRMMTIHSDFNLKSMPTAASKKNSIRFVAASATIPNTEDFSEWFGFGGRPSASQKLGEEFRPVKLQKVVIGYPCLQNWTDFRFDMTLSYKLIPIINRYSEGKPCLVFCSTRKGVIQTSSILVNESKLILSTQLKQKLVQSGNSVRDNKLKDFLSSGVGYHHAGLDYHDRKIVEELFIRSELPILVATSTLAMGVNLPAHLVIVKSTMYYDNGQFIEYNDTQILQMIGRAGRPQFDTSATAVIMTKDFQKAKYEKFISGTQIIESSLHKNLAEYLNVEIVLKTITDLGIAMQWIRSTFLYVRIMKNPTHYGLSSNLSENQIEKKLQEMCTKELNSLAATQLIQMDEHGFDFKSTEAGRLMAQYCVSLNTMKRFRNIKGTESISDLLQVISASEEFCEIQLRTSEKKTLNTLNKDKHLQTISLIQAAFGCISIQDWTLSQETTRILRIGQRLSKCLSEYISIKDDFKSVLGCIILAKCFRARLWENSKHVARQLEKIGNTLSNNLVQSGLTTFQKIEETNPRQLELILNRHPPFGSHIKDAVASLPKYEVAIEQISKYESTTADVNITVTLTNFQLLKENGTQWSNPRVVLIIGDQDNKIVFKQRIVNSLTHGTGKWNKRLNITKAQKGHELIIDLINEQYVGLDVHCSFTPFYFGGKNVSIKRNFTTSDARTDDFNEPASEDEFVEILESQPEADKPLWQFNVQKERRTCAHRCRDKTTCAHECCKVGVMKTSGKPSSKSTSKCSQSKNTPKEQTKGMLSNTITKFCTDVKNKVQAMPAMSCSRTFVKASPNVEIADKVSKTRAIDLKQFEYKSLPKSSFTMNTCDDLEDSWANDADNSYFDFDIPTTDWEAENASSGKLKETSYSELQHCSSPAGDFDEILEEVDGDLWPLHKDNSNSDFDGDFPELTIEDFQDDPSEVIIVSQRTVSNRFNFEESYNFPKKRKLSPAFTRQIQSPGFPKCCSPSKIGHPISANRTKAKNWSYLKPNNSTTSTGPGRRNFKTDFVSANQVYKDSLSGESEDFSFSSSPPKLLMEMPTAVRYDSEMPINIDNEVIGEIGAESIKTDSTVKSLSQVLPQKQMSDSREVVITDKEINSNPELQEAVHMFCHIFSDIF